MKQNKVFLILISLVVLTMQSCYTYSYTVGKGAKDEAQVIKKKNHYLVEGLVNLKQSDPKEMAGNSEDYEVVIKHSVLDIILFSLTGGIYSPTTTIVKK